MGLPLTLFMDKLQLTGKNLRRLFIFSIGCMNIMHWCWNEANLSNLEVLKFSQAGEHYRYFLSLNYIGSLPNLKLKTQPKQLLGSRPFDIALPALFNFSRTWETKKNKSFVTLSPGRPPWARTTGYPRWRPRTPWRSRLGLMFEELSNDAEKEFQVFRCPVRQISLIFFFIPPFTDNTDLLIREYKLKGKAKYIYLLAPTSLVLLFCINLTSQNFQAKWASLVRRLTVPESYPSVSILWSSIYAFCTWLINKFVCVVTSKLKDGTIFTGKANNWRAKESVACGTQEWPETNKKKAIKTKTLKTVSAKCNHSKHNLFLP